MAKSDGHEPQICLLAAECLVAAGLNFEIIDHAFHAGNSSADAYRLPHIPVVENHPTQCGDAIFYGHGDMFVIKEGV